MTMRERTHDLETFTGRHERLPGQRRAQHLDRVGRQRRDVPQRFVADLAVTAIRSPQQPRHILTILVLAYNFRDVHSARTLSHNDYCTPAQTKRHVFTGYNLTAFRTKTPAQQGLSRFSPRNFGLGRQDEEVQRLSDEDVRVYARLYVA